MKDKVIKLDNISAEQLYKEVERRQEEIRQRKLNEELKEREEEYKKVEMEKISNYEKYPIKEYPSENNKTKISDNNLENEKRDNTWIIAILLIFFIINIALVITLVVELKDMIANDNILLENQIIMNDNLNQINENINATNTNVILAQDWIIQNLRQ